MATAFRKSICHGSGVKPSTSLTNITGSFLYFLRNVTKALFAWVACAVMRLLGVGQRVYHRVERHVPQGVEVVSAFQNVSSHRLQDLEHDRVVAAQDRPEAGTGAGEAGHHGADRYAQRLCGLLVGQLFDRHQRQEIPGLPGRELR